MHSALVTGGTLNSRRATSPFVRWVKEEERYAKFESGDESITKEDQDWPETVVDNEILRAIFQQNPYNTVRDYAEKLGVTLTTISRI
ncbi:hypothetical protein TNCV_583171 [Trichonephila clavipes]|nr:hypothetical protein TNCV_583171 [Trichonephila clavipes]